MEQLKDAPGIDGADASAAELPTAVLPELEEIGDFIRGQRLAAGLSMDALAARADVGRSTLHRIEFGPRATTAVRPTPWKLACVLRALGVRAAQVADVIGDGAWGSEILFWLDRDDRPVATDEGEGDRDDQVTVLRIEVPAGSTVTVRVE